MNLSLTVAGEELLLLPQKAVYWPRLQTLVVADIHFGKAASFRALGVPVPAGTTSANLAALDALLALHAVREVVFLGDFLHAKAAHAPATLAAMQAWRERHPGLGLALVCGNHDAHAGDPPAALGIEVVDEPWLVGPFAFCHHPDVLSPAYVMAGHVHPVFRLRSGWEGVRLPCFLMSKERLVLPSFGAFTGGHAVLPQPGERVFVTSGEAVLEVPDAAP
ncbi:ligase-associated DNA damage response endonuclease PdeM [Duganella sp. BuS-21]|uniref:ligase-associated DNA damage response endonuclease PdeM n=1 Tax=Duganella sp. BuS-21 TaxID=2943848 RepID=UPI0035A72718